jgi:lipoprotein-releasing system permease protein
VGYELFIARRYLRAKQKAGFISLITYIAVGGVILGVASLLIILSVVNGFAGELKSLLIGMNSHVTVRQFYGDMIKDYDEVMQRLEDYPGIEGMAPVIESKVLIASKRNTDKIDGILVWGVDDTNFGSVSDLPQYLLYDEESKMRLGPVEGKPKARGIVLGEYLARRLRVGPGDEVLLVTVTGADLENALTGAVPKFHLFVVTDTFESGLYQYDDNYAFIALEDAQRMLGLQEGSANNIHLRLSDFEQAVELRDTLDDDLGYPFSVRDWTQINPELFQWIELEKMGVLLALSLIIVVAAFNIMSILSMSILVKTPEIGILRTMGATAAGIRRIFVYQGMFIGLAGTACGCVLGLGVCLLQQHFSLISIPGEIYIIDSLPVDMQAADFVAVTSVSLVICLLASIYPARKAARLIPVDAISYIV